MSDSETGHTAKGYRDLSDEMRQEFLDEAVELLQGLDVLLDSSRNGRSSGADVVAEFRRVALRLKGQAANFGLRPLATVAIRLDDYLLQAPKDLPPRVWDDLQKFQDVLLALAEGRVATDTATAVLVRQLPVRLGFDVRDVEIRDIEVMLVMPPGAQTRFVEREMQQCGYRVSVVPDTIDAFSLAVQTKPDLIVVSAMMPHLDGIDLAIGLVSMPATRNIPIAVITSLDQGDDRLALLPAKVPVLHKGPSFGDDLFKALDNLFLI
jgi:CheY-like chemotaxis protein/HPt (histidine-containing phosphotransfer) domain-containing protein